MPFFGIRIETRRVLHQKLA